MENKERRELILFLLSEINESSMTGITEYRLNKVLFKLEQELPKDHILKYSIPFYWYFHGPFSDWLRNELRILLQEEIVEKVIVNGNHLYKLVAESFPNREFIDNKVETLTSKLLNPEIFFKIDRIVYDEDAPHKFMPLYKFDFLETIRDYKNSIENSEEDQSLIEEAIKISYKCENYLPFDDHYLEYNDIFSNFILNLDILNENQSDTLYIDEITRNALETWYTFGYGVRVKEHHPFYEDENILSEWNYEFKSQLFNLNLLMDAFNEITLQNSKLEKVRISESSNQILSTVGTYLSCDKNGYR